MLKIALSALAALALSGTAATAQVERTTTTTTTMSNPMGTRTTERTTVRTNTTRMHSDRSWHAKRGWRNVRQCKTWWHHGRKMRSCKMVRRHW